MVEKEVLNELKPHNESLKLLKVVSYGGIELPNWVGDPSFLQLKHVSIHGCKRCLSLPSLGQLPSLKELSIKGLHEVKGVGLEFLGCNGTFPLLEILRFEEMPGWEVWSANSRVVFPCLQELCINNCPNLAEVSLEALPSLRVLRLSRCDDVVLRSLVEVAPKVIELQIIKISGLTDDVWRGVTKYIGAVEKLTFGKCNEIKYLWESEAEASKVFVNLRNLTVGSCDNLVSLRKKEDAEEGDCGSSLPLTSLWICGGENMERCSVPNNIEELVIDECDSLTEISFPSGGGQKFKTIRILGCKKLMKKELGGYEGGDKSMMILNNISMPILEILYIDGLPNLKFITKLNCFLHLTTLTISNCSSLESVPDEHLLHLVSLKSIEIKNCPRLNASFPRGNWPPNLSSLEIGQLKKPISQWGPQNFPPSLVELHLDGRSWSDDNKEEDVIYFSQLSHHLLPPSLTNLRIDYFEKLESNSTGLQHLTSLQSLVINDCPKLKDLPDILFPSLLDLEIRRCPDLKERYSRDGSHWPLISHIPCIVMLP